MKNKRLCMEKKIRQTRERNERKALAVERWKKCFRVFLFFSVFIHKFKK